MRSENATTSLLKEGRLLRHFIKTRDVKNDAEGLTKARGLVWGLGLIQETSS